MIGHYRVQGEPGTQSEGHFRVKTNAMNERAVTDTRNPRHLMSELARPQSEARIS